MRRFTGAFAVLVFVCYLAVYMMISYAPVAGVFNDNTAVMNAAGEKMEGSLLNFIERHLLSEGGKICTNTMDGGEATLSESVGLIMNYCVISGRKSLFDTEFFFLKEELTVDERFIKWKTGINVSCNALVDDMRIIRALMDAYEKWGDKAYLDAAGFMQDAVFDRQTDDGKIYEFFDWKSNTGRKSIPLCYLDMYTFDRLRVFNKDWARMSDNSLSIIKNGRYREASPFFYKHYSYDTGIYTADEEYKKGKKICLTYTLLTNLHLVEMNENTEYFTQWLKEEMNNGKLFGWYNPDTLAPADSLESTAVYALAAVYALRVGEPVLYNRLINRMSYFMVNDKKSPYYGGFGDEKTGQFYSFDNLTALWALGAGRK